MSVSLDRGRLYLVVPGQGRFELEARQGTEFGINGLAGCGVEFKVADSGAVTGAEIIQPGGRLQLARS